MLLQHLKRLDCFAHLTWSELNTIAQHTQVLSIPRSRWLLRRGRRLTGAYFLVRGRLRLWGPDRTLTAAEPAAGQPFYPGSAAAFAVTAVQLLQVNTRPIAFLLDALPGSLGGCDFADEPWLARFLDSSLLQRLDTARWQQVLRGMSAHAVSRNRRVLTQGEPGAHFYVIQRGRARVHRGTQELALLGPGDFFGEDALIAGAPRNASVTALTDCSLLRLPRSAFLRLLVQGVVPSAQQVTGARARQLQIGPALQQDAQQLCLPLHDLRQHLSLLEPHCDYYVSGADVPARALAVFILLQRGFRAWVLSPGQPITPAPFAPQPSSAAG